MNVYEALGFEPTGEMRLDFRGVMVAAMAEEAVGEGRSAGDARLNPYVAGALSLLWPGVGQIYSGRWRRGVAFMLAVPLLAVPAYTSTVVVPLPVLNLLPMVLPFGLQILAIIDAVKGAHRTAQANRPWYAHWLVCTVLAVSNVLVWAPALGAAVRGSLVHAFKIPSGGMEPTILIGDRILVNKFAYDVRNPVSGGVWLHRREPHRGDLVAFLFPDDRQRVFLKRVIGLPGETVEIRGTRVCVDGRVQSEAYALYFDGSADSWGPQVVPERHLFVLGDNRGNSRDSRYWGFVPIADVLGEAKVVYFSVEHARGESAPLSLSKVRWRRLGKILR